MHGSHAIDGVSRPRQILQGPQCRSSLRHGAAPCRVQGGFFKGGEKIATFTLTSKPRGQAFRQCLLSVPPPPQHTQLLLGDTEDPGPQ